MKLYFVWCQINLCLKQYIGINWKRKWSINNFSYSLKRIFLGRIMCNLKTIFINLILNSFKLNYSPWWNSLLVKDWLRKNPHIPNNRPFCVNRRINHIFNSPCVNSDIWYKIVYLLWWVAVVFVFSCILASFNRKYYVAIFHSTWYPFKK